MRQNLEKPWRYSGPPQDLAHHEVQWNILKRSVDEALSFNDLSEHSGDQKRPYGLCKGAFPCGWVEDDGFRVIGLRVTEFPVPCMQSLCLEPSLIN